MAAAEEGSISGDEISKVIEMAAEPSYISEIARKLLKVDEGWPEVEKEVNAVGRVTAIVAFLEENEPEVLDIIEPFEGYERTGGQVRSSRKPSVLSDSPTDTWNTYTVVHAPALSEDEVREGFRPVVDTERELTQKLETIRRLSGVGNEVSREAELILQDVMERQFRYYETVETSDYNDPGIDLYVEDEGQREYGLSIEISVRWVNPIGSPYIESKRNKAFDRDSDLLIIAPRFSQSALDRYEDPEDPDWHASPLSEMVHLHTVPSENGQVYYPFVKSPEVVTSERREGSGNPVLVPDSERLRGRLRDTGHVGDEYPVVEGDREAFQAALESVERDYVVVPESQYRNMIREAVEPLLWQFLRPYLIEQFLIDTYWDKGLTQSEIGRLVDRSGSTISRWMRRQSVLRRGTGAPELSNEVVEIWKRMYRGEEPFPEQFSGYRIQAEYNRHPLWTLDDWREWFRSTSENERREVMRLQDPSRENLDYTVMVGPNDRLLPSYTFILQTLRDEGVEIREPDLAPRVPYAAYPSRKALEMMLNRNQNTIVDVSDNE